jgi:hypothetical protein
VVCLNCSNPKRDTGLNLIEKVILYDRFYMFYA